MRRQVGEPQLVGAAEAAQTLGVHQTNLRRVHDLPEPYAHVKATTLWRARDILDLARRRNDPLS